MREYSKRKIFSLIVKNNEKFKYKVIIIIPANKVINNDMQIIWYYQKWEEEIIEGEPHNNEQEIQKKKVVAL